MAGLFNRLQDEIEVRDSQTGLSPIDLLDMPEQLAAVINRIPRATGGRPRAAAASFDD